MGNRTACAFVFVLLFAFSESARADCQDLLSDGLSACPCLVCPCILVPALCIATVVDEPWFWDAANGGCICFLCVGIDGPIVGSSASGEVPLPSALRPPSSTILQMAY